MANAYPGWTASGPGLVYNKGKYTKRDIAISDKQSEVCFN